jgi:7,8-dihydropterin-6-yl-methyl-4-(beta-D-ribofuranosyl)aminobenzene 5'-phosphate synthase
MKITVLTENTKLENSDLIAEHGISLFVEKDGYNILFDMGGPQESAIKNASRLDIDLRKVDAVIISHGHNDHTGGLLKFLQINDKAPVYLKKEALGSYYSKRPEGEKYIGIDSKIVEKYAERLYFMDKTVEIAKNIFIVPNIYKEFPVPSSNSVLFEKVNGKLVRDNFKHESFMVIENDNKLTVFTGCGHSGIKNIINTAKEAFPDKKIGNVIGGFHLQAGARTFEVAEKEEIEEIAEWLKLEAAGQIYTGHCTGERAMKMMRPILKNKLNEIYAGMRIHI